jgi:hypothetical protein
MAAKARVTSNQLALQRVERAFVESAWFLGEMRLGTARRSFLVPRTDIILPLVMATSMLFEHSTITVKLVRAVVVFVAFHGLIRFLSWLFWDRRAQFTNVDVVSSSALFGALKTIREGDLELAAPSHRAKVYSGLVKAASPEYLRRYGSSLALIWLDTIERAGTLDARQYLHAIQRRLIGTEHRALVQRTQECLETLEQRGTVAASSDGLLRSSDCPTTAVDLLRPAGKAGDTDPSALLRTVQRSKE